MLHLNTSVNVSFKMCLHLSILYTIHVYIVNILVAIIIYFSCDAMLVELTCRLLISRWDVSHKYISETNITCY